MSYATTNRGVLREHLEMPEAYVGYWVLDAEGRKLGSVKEIFVNAYDEPEYIRMKMGFWVKVSSDPSPGHHGKRRAT